MEMKKERQEELTKQAYDIADNYGNDEELLFIIKDLQFWYKERKRQEKEIKKLERKEKNEKQKKQ